MAYSAQYVARGTDSSGAAGATVMRTLAGQVTGDAASASCRTAGCQVAASNAAPRLTNLVTHQRTLLNNLARHDPTTLRLADTGNAPEPPRQGEQLSHDRDALPSADRSRIEDDLKKLPRGNNNRIRTVGAESELRDLFKTWKRGGTDITPQNYDDTLIRLSDGTQVGYRHTSTSGGAAIDMYFTDGKWRKVHINGS